ncbi:MAG: helix-turn-helix domain-containing protein [Treponema sp.]|nr:helix-turn-helix domain-containing protein [Treponema sp.]
MPRRAFRFRGPPDASPTCRHFGICRSCFYRWKKRYDPKRLSSLENKKTVPKRKREPGYSRELTRPCGTYGKRTPAIRRKKYGLFSCGSGRKPPYPPRPPWEGS